MSPTPTVSQTSNEAAMPVRKTGPRSLLPSIILLAYAAMVLWLTVHHEPWRDEADAWLVARDNNFEGLFRLMGYAGTPMLWYLSIWPLVKLGLPCESMNLLNAFLGIATAALILFCAPLSLHMRALILFGYLFSYEYPVVARSYQLSILLIFSLAAIHKRRFDKPLFYSGILALLANTNINGLIVATSVGVTHLALLFRAKAKLVDIGKFALPLAIGVILSVVQLLPPKDGQFSPTSIQSNWETVVVAIKESFVPSVENFNHGIQTIYGGHPVLEWTLVPALLCIAAIFFQIRKSRFAIGVVFIAWLGLFLLIIFKYPGFIRHWGFLFVTAIYALWVANYESQKPDAFPVKADKLADAVISSVLLFSVATAVQTWLLETQNKFSGAASAAKFIKEKNLHSLPMAGYRNFAVESLLPYLPGKKVFYPEISEYGTHMRWNRGYSRTLDQGKLLRRLRREFGVKTKFLIVVSDHPKQTIKLNPNDFELLYKSEPDVILADEKYSIYIRTINEQKPPVSGSTEPWKEDPGGPQKGPLGRESYLENKLDSSHKKISGHVPTSTVKCPASPADKGLLRSRSLQSVIISGLY